MRHLLLAVVGGLALGSTPAAAAADPIMPLSQVHAGLDCKGETVVQGTAISSFDVHVIDIVQDPQEGPRILISVSGPAVDRTGIAEGFSGSPVLCDDGTGTARNIGAISETVGEYGNKVALVTPIEQMLGEPVRPPSSAPRLFMHGRPLLGPLTIGGLSPSLLALAQRAAREAGRTVIGIPSGSTLSFPVQDLVPGAAVATQYATGAIPLGAVGTVTYRDGNTVYAFGHPLDGAGRRSLILTDAYVYYVINSPDSAVAPSYKLASPGHPEGTLTSDTPNAVIGTVGPGPPTTPVDVTAHDGDTGRTIVLHSQVADETDVGDPLGGSLLGLVAPLQIAQSVISIYDGAPSNETGRMCLTVSLRESRRPLQFCNRYVAGGVPGSGGQLPPALSLLTSTDATNALGLLDAQSFGQLHVTHVEAGIVAQRGLREATILSAHAPTRVRAGHTVRVELRVRRYRGATKSIWIPLRIPGDARGRLTAKISNSSASSSSDALGNALASALFGGGGTGSLGGSSPRPPRSLAELRKAFAGVGVYDGLDVRFGQRKPRHIYRDPSMLINGSAKLVFRVAR